MAKRTNRKKKKTNTNRRSADRTPSTRRDHVELEGTITSVYAAGHFEVELDNGPSIKAEIGGRMRRYRIRVLLGDRVRVALSPYDLTHGLIVYRSKEPARRVA